MDAEQIVRKLATGAPPVEGEYDMCILCGQQFDHEDIFEGGSSYDPMTHKPECEWRLAHAWAAEHPDLSE